MRHNLFLLMRLRDLYKKNLLCLVDYATPTDWMSPFEIEGGYGNLFFLFFSTECGKSVEKSL